MSLRRVRLVMMKKDHSHTKIMHASERAAILSSPFQKNSAEPGPACLNASKHRSVWHKGMARQRWLLTCTLMSWGWRLIHGVDLKPLMLRRCCARSLMVGLLSADRDLSRI